MKLKTIIFVLSSFAVCFIAFAHSDKSLTVSEGILVGLPEQYTPATFSYETRELVIGTNSVVLPYCATNFFGEITKENLWFSASWHHDEELLPPYLNIENGKIMFLVNLNSLELIHYSERSEQIELTQEMLDEFKNNWVINNNPNQRVEPTVKTSGDPVNEQGTDTAHP